MNQKILQLVRDLYAFEPRKESEFQKRLAEIIKSADGQIVYKIRHKETGLYSTGGMTPKWTKTGKIWKNKGALNGHRSLVDSHYTWQRLKYHPYLAAEVVVLKTIEVETWNAMKGEEVI